MRLAVARLAAKALRLLPWRLRVRLVLAAMRRLARGAAAPDGPCLCTACGTRLESFVADYGTAPAARLLGVAGTAKNPRLYGGARRLFCPVCLEPERTRFLLHRLATDEVLAADAPRQRILVCSGGPALLHRLAAQDVVSANLRPTLFADTACDLRAAPFPDASFDLVLCSYVLDEIDDEAAALSELRRILRPGGLAWIIVPIDLSQATTQEGRGEPDEVRAEKFGSAVHQRLYGLDAGRHFAAAGFDVIETIARDAMLPAAIAAQGIQPEERLFRLQPAR